MSRTQFRAKSGLAFVMKEIGAAEETGETGASGKTQATMPAAIRESWFWPAVCGTTGADGEAGDDFAWQQGILQPCWQWQEVEDGCFAQRAGNSV